MQQKRLLWWLRKIKKLFIAHKCHVIKIQVIYLFNEDNNSKVWEKSGKRSCMWNLSINSITQSVLWILSLNTNHKKRHFTTWDNLWTEKRWKFTQNQWMIGTFQSKRKENSWTINHHLMKWHHYYCQKRHYNLMR